MINIASIHSYNADDVLGLLAASTLIRMVQGYTGLPKDSIHDRSLGALALWSQSEFSLGYLFL